MFAKNCYNEGREQFEEKSLLHHQPGKGLHETIVEKRLEVLKRKLASSRQSIAAVTSACGFANQTHVKTLFKRKTGLTIGEWRKRQSP